MLVMDHNASEVRDYAKSGGTSWYNWWKQTQEVKYNAWEKFHFATRFHPLLVAYCPTSKALCSVSNIHIHKSSHRLLACYRIPKYIVNQNEKKGGKY